MATLWFSARTPSECVIKNPLSIFFLMAIFRLNNQYIFPPPELAEESGLLAVGGDLHPERLIAAYRVGIFPWFSDGDPLLWWFTSPRLVLFPDEFKVSSRIQRYRRNSDVQITFDQDFESVIGACANSRRRSGEETWIVGKMQKAYIKLHKMGYAHSVECWQNDTLTGGLYGIALGNVFFGESMFSEKPNSSKFALIELISLLKKKDFKIIDCQMTTSHLVSFGAREISGKDFQKQLQLHIEKTTPNGYWHNDTNKRT